MGRSMLSPYKNNPERSLTALRSVRDDDASSRRQLPEPEVVAAAGAPGA
jgi:hypothetical protein